MKTFFDFLLNDYKLTLSNIFEKINDELFIVKKEK